MHSKLGLPRPQISQPLFYSPPASSLSEATQHLCNKNFPDFSYGRRFRSTAGYFCCLTGGQGSKSQVMENILGLLRIKVIRGIHLAVRDTRSSDPYVIFRLGKQKLKTRVVKKNLNPEWNDELTLTISDPNVPIKLKVYDKDTFSRDDPMGDAEFSIKEFVEAQKLQLESVPSGSVIKKIVPNRQNCLSEESPIKWENGKVKQHMYLRLRNVECGEIELELNWIKINGSKE